MARRAELSDLLAQQPPLFTAGDRTPIALLPVRIETVYELAAGACDLLVRIYPHPERFDPNRFRATRPTAPVWLPFGGGAHRCLGAGFAIAEMDVVLRTVLRSFQIQADAAPYEKSYFRGIAHTPKLAPA